MTEEVAVEQSVNLEDFQQGFLAGWLHAQGWTTSPTFEQFSAAAVAWESWMETQGSTKQ
jgi:hypothetical protein